MVTRIQAARLTRIKGANGRAPRTFIQSQKQKETQRISDTQFQAGFKTDVTKYIIGSSNISNAERKATNLINTQINELEPRLRSGAILSINDAVNTLRSKQNAYIRSLQADIKTYDSKADRYNDLWSTNYKNKGNIWKEREVKYETRRDEAKKILSAVRTGTIYNTTEVNKFLSAVGTQAGKIARRAETRQIIGAKFQRITPKTSTIEREKAIDTIAIQIAQGATATDKELRELGLTSKEITKIKQVKELETKRRKSILKTYEKPLDTSIFTAKGAKYAKLAQRDKDLVNQYQTLKDIKNTGGDITKLYQYDTYLSKNLKFSPKINTKQMLNIIDSYNLPIQDRKTISSLKKISDSELKTRLLKGRTEKLDKSIIAYNRIINKYETSQKNLINDSLKTIKTKYALQVVLSKAGQVRPLKLLYLAGLIKILEKKQKNKQQITFGEVQDFKNASDDFFELKTWKRIFKASKYNPKTKIKANRLITSILLIKFLKNVTVATAKEVQQTAKFFIYGIAPFLYKGVIRTAKGTYKVTSDAWNESIQLIAAKINKLPKSEQKKIFANTQRRINAITKGIKTTAEFSRKIISNPMKYLGVIGIGIAVFYAQSTTKMRKVLATNPEKALGFLLSFPVEAAIAGAAIKGAKLLKAAVSPLVIKGVTVFDGSSIRGSAKALKALEGKKIDIFSSTSSDIKKMFKGTDLSRAEETKLIKDMLKNPEIYIGSNLKIKPLSQIAKSSTKRAILQYMKLTQNGILSGSASLKLQLAKFRKVGDFDIIAKNAKSFTKNLVKNLNDSMLNKAFKFKRFEIKSARGVYTITDKFTKKHIADIVDMKRAITNLGKITKSNIIKIDGVRILKIQKQLPIKAALLRDPLFTFRTVKETKDLKLILKNAKELLNNKKFTQLRKFLNENDEFLKVKGFASESGLDRQYSWVRKYFPDLNLGFSYNAKKVKMIRARLKKIGFTDRMIDNNIRLYTPSDFYFAPNMVYTEYLRGGKTGGIIFAKNVKISRYPKNIQKLINKNIKGMLSVKEQAQLRGQLRIWRLKNPDKAFIGEKALADRFGEIEVLAPEYTKLFPKRTILKREIYIPSLETFIRAQEVVIGKAPRPVLQTIAKNIKNKLKKGYTLKQATKDITKLLEGKLKNYGKYLKSIIKPTKSEQKVLRDLLKSLENQEDIIKKAKNLSKSKKESLLKTVRRTKKRLDIKSYLRNKAVIRATISRIISRIRKTVRPTTKIARRIKPITRKASRPIKRATKTVRAKPRPRPTKRPVTRVRSTLRPISRTPARPRRPITRRPITSRPITKQPPKKVKIPRLFLDNKKLKKGELLIFNGRIKVRGKIKTLQVKTTFNRAVRKLTKLIDNTTARSFDLVVVGKSRIKEIATPASLRKFRIRVKNSNALTLVEKSKYAIDTIGEKKGLSISKALKKNKKNTKKTAKKVRSNKPKQKKRTKRR